MSIRTNCFREDCLANSSSNPEMNDKGLCTVLDINRDYCAKCPFYMNADMKREREIGIQTGKYVPIVMSNHSLDEEWKKIGGYENYLNKRKDKK